MPATTEQGKTISLVTENPVAGTPSGAPAKETSYKSTDLIIRINSGLQQQFEQTVKIFHFVISHKIIMLPDVVIAVHPH
ncbi:MAG: hypothetical protein QG652_715 [Pseudomonadota bacterium]|nr:hypothetical protein [Pseudomonadota bacterium]